MKRYQLGDGNPFHLPPDDFSQYDWPRELRDALEALKSRARAEAKGGDDLLLRQVRLAELALIGLERAHGEKLLAIKKRAGLAPEDEMTEAEDFAASRREMQRNRDGLGPDTDN